MPRRYRSRVYPARIWRGIFTSSWLKRLPSLLSPSGSPANLVQGEGDGERRNRGPELSSRSSLSPLPPTRPRPDPALLKKVLGVCKHLAGCLEIQTAAKGLKLTSQNESLDPGALGPWSRPFLISPGAGCGPKPSVGACSWRMHAGQRSTVSSLPGRLLATP